MEIKDTFTLHRYSFRPLHFCYGSSASTLYRIKTVSLPFPDKESIIESMAVVSRDGLDEESLKQTKTSTLYGSDPSDIENNILFEIKQLKKAKKRANTQSVIERVSGRLGLSDEGIASRLNELVQSGKIIASTNRGKETFKLRDERDDADSHIAYDPDLNKSDDDSYLWEGQDTAFNGKHFGCEMYNQSITPQIRPSHEAAMVTLPISIVSDLTKNSNMVNEILKRERQLVYDQMRENTELKLKIKDLEAGPFNLHGQMTSEPPKSRKPPEDPITRTVYYLYIIGIQFYQNLL